MPNILLAAASMAMGLAGPVYIQANYDLEGEHVVSRTVSKADVYDAIAKTNDPDITLTLSVPNLTPYKAMQSELVQQAPIEHTVFMPYLADGQALVVDGSAIPVEDAEDLEAKYNEGLRSFVLSTHCLEQSRLAAAKVEELAARDSKRAVTVLQEAEETARFRRRLLDIGFGNGNDTTAATYVLNMTPNILAGLLIGLFLITTAYCGFMIMLDIEVPLRIREKQLPLRKGVSRPPARLGTKPVPSIPCEARNEAR